MKCQMMNRFQWDEEETKETKQIHTDRYGENVQTEWQKRDFRNPF
jgi:hypothetical protein